METKNERFKRLASKRTNEVIEKLRILGNLSNKSSYSYSEADLNKIFRTIDEALKEVKSGFIIKKKKEKFTL